MHAVTALRCVHSSLTKIATTPIETCTSAGVLHHTFYTSSRPDVILVITFLVILMTFLLTLWAVLSLNLLCKGSTANLVQCLDNIIPPKLRTPLYLLVQHVSQPVCHIAIGPCLLDSIQVIVGEAKLSSQFTPFGRY